ASDSQDCVGGAGCAACARSAAAEIGLSVIPPSRARDKIRPPDNKRACVDSKSTSSTRRGLCGPPHMCPSGTPPCRACGTLAERLRGQAPSVLSAPTPQAQSPSADAPRVAACPVLVEHLYFSGAPRELYPPPSAAQPGCHADWYFSATLHDCSAGFAPCLVLVCRWLPSQR